VLYSKATCLAETGPFAVGKRSNVTSVSVCLSHCVPICEHISELHVRSSPVLCMLPMAVAQSSSRGLQRYEVMYVNYVVERHVDTVAASDVSESSCAS